MEGARADRDRMKTLLVEAIATLCRNGLQYDEELCVEGLIGITLDKRDVFLVSVKETFSSSVASNANVTKNGRDTPQSVDSPQTVSKKAHKRSGASTNEGPPEKNKRKGNAPKQIPVEEIELLNNSPSAHDVSLEDNNSDTVQSDPLHAGATIAGTGTYEPYDQNSRSSIGDSEAIVIEDPDLPSIKKEIVKQENQNSCMYTPSAKRSPMTKPAYSDSSQKHSRPMPPLHPRPDQPSPGSADPNDPRSKHPAGVDPEQFAIFAQEIKTEQDSDPDLSVFTSPSGEIIRVPRSMNSMNQDQAIPVSMVSSGTLSGATASTSGTLPMEGMADFSGVPVDWGSPSTSQEFITMPGDDSTQESPSQQAPGSSGASQQITPTKKDFVSVSVADNGKKIFICKLCDIRFSRQDSAVRHVQSVHRGHQYFCTVCDKKFKRQDHYMRHLKQKHADVANIFSKPKTDFVYVRSEELRLEDVQNYPGDKETGVVFPVPDVQPQPK